MTRIVFLTLTLAGALLFLSGCASMASTALQQLQPTAEPTVAPVATIATGQDTAAPPTPTPIGGSSAPLLFVSNRGTAPATDIYQINADGSGLARLTVDPANESQPRWSPDRRQVAFVSDRSGLDQIYLISLADYVVTQLTDRAAGATAPTWSPGGAQIAIVDPDPAPDPGVLLIVDATTGAETSRHPVDLYGLANLAWSRDGRVIAFSAVTPGQTEDRDVFSLNLSNDRLINLTNRPGDDDHPAWSPDGKRLAFDSDRNGDPDIYVMQANGSLQTILTLTGATDVEPHWSADGTLIAFSSDRDGPFQLYVMRENGSEVRVVAPVEADDGQPRWSPRAQPVIDELSYTGGAVAGAHDLYVVTASGSQKEQLTKTAAHEMTPAWSPDGSRLVVASDRAGNLDLYLLNADGSGEPRRLTDRPGSDLHPDWSPDGELIAFESKNEGGDWDVWIVRADGSELHNITNMPNADDGNPAWSPDGRFLLFSSNRAGTFDLYLLAVDSEAEPERLTSAPGNEVHPCWLPDGERIIFRAEEIDDGRRQLYSMSRKGDGIKPLFTSAYNDDWPSCAPDGRRVAFSSDRVNSTNRQGAGSFAIYTYDLRTARLEAVTPATRDARYPAWNPLSAQRGQ